MIVYIIGVFTKQVFFLLILLFRIWVNYFQLLHWIIPSSFFRVYLDAILLASWVGLFLFYYLLILLWWLCSTSFLREMDYLYVTRSQASLGQKSCMFSSPLYLSSEHSMKHKESLWTQRLNKWLNARLRASAFLIPYMFPVGIYLPISSTF